MKEAKEYVSQALSEVRSLQHRPLEEVQKRIAEAEARVSSFDFDQLKTDEMSPDRVGDFEAESMSVNAEYDKEWFVPTTQYTDSAHKRLIEKTNERTEKAKRA